MPTLRSPLIAFDCAKAVEIAAVAATAIKHEAFIHIT